MLAIEAEDPMQKWREYEEKLHTVPEQDSYRNRDLNVDNENEELFIEQNEGPPAVET